MKQRSVSRRNFVAGACAGAGLIALGGIGFSLGSGEDLLRPPGGQDALRLESLCIRCDRCRQACPRSAIRSCGIEDGLTSLRTPALSFKVKIAKAYRRAGGQTQEDVLANPYPALLDAQGIGYCDFCMECVKVCPTGALADFDPTSQRIGVAVVDAQRCLAFANSGGCRKCTDYCAFDAIYLDDQRRPVVDASRCNGCGICENVCPTDSYRSFSGKSLRGINVFSESSSEGIAALTAEGTRYQSGIKADGKDNAGASASAATKADNNAEAEAEAEANAQTDDAYVLEQRNEGGQDR